MDGYLNGQMGPNLDRHTQTDVQTNFKNKELKTNRDGLIDELQGPYSQHFIFFTTYECSKKLEYLVTRKPFSLV
jgi:hypothetical protein